jgi:2-amino-4-hydroxy-6-hydroxymethyldihydropteridine diphosphokinase
VIQLVAQNQYKMSDSFWQNHRQIVRSLQKHSIATGHATLPAMPSSLPPRSAVHAYIALGANLGDPQATVRHAIKEISESSGMECLAVSSIYKTAPIDSAGPDYINAVMKVSCLLPAYTLLFLLQKIEHSANRERPYRNAPRTLDLDVLLYGSAHIESAVLTVPHPRMWERAFVLQPLQEIAPELVSEEALLAVAGQRVECLIAA